MVARHESASVGTILASSATADERHRTHARDRGGLQGEIKYLKFLTTKAVSTVNYTHKILSLSLVW